jgi:SAM-dependent methyltransferase
MTKTLDLGCGPQPKNPFNYQQAFGIDIVDYNNPNIQIADLAVEKIPHPDNSFDAVSAYDFLEHIPRIIYNPNRRFPFVELMNEIHRVLVPGGLLYSHTPAFPAPAVFRDPTHVNIITEETLPFYFGEPHNWAKIYGYTGHLVCEQQHWQGNIHLVTVMKKV